jgi:GT2 family glycosyltransferase
MFGGSGTNIKMFDFFAAGLPVVTTETGARGIDEIGRIAFLVAAPERFVDYMNLLLHHPIVSRQMSTAARQLATDLYSWERISANLGILLTRRRRYSARAKPRFSVIVPTYERHDHLEALLRTLEHQTERDFEVIVVDQSRDPWPLREVPTNLDLLYVHTPIRGAVKARNLGAYFAYGEVLAYTDDDCVPDPGWLQNARAYVDKPGVVGVEGYIRSDKLGDPDYRPVTNEGFAGIGFMTANLLVRADAFARCGGFDTRFDNPHFREDTDLGWRLQRLGEVPFGRDVSVYHPPHRRTNQRESVAARVRFFEKDALLLRKHPSKYRELFFLESQWLQFPQFARNFYSGIARYRTPVPDYAAHALHGPHG